MNMSKTRPSSLLNVIRIIKGNHYDFMWRRNPPSVPQRNLYPYHQTFHAMDDKDEHHLHQPLASSNAVISTIITSSSNYDLLDTRLVSLRSRSIGRNKMPTASWIPFDRNWRFTLQQCIEILKWQFLRKNECVVPYGFVGRQPCWNTEEIWQI